MRAAREGVRTRYEEPTRERSANATGAGVVDARRKDSGYSAHSAGIAGTDHLLHVREGTALRSARLLREPVVGHA